MSKSPLGERERIARIIDPEGWRVRQHNLMCEADRLAWNTMEGVRQAPGFREAADRASADSLAKADLILSALLPEEGQGLSPSQSQPGCDDSASRDASADAEPSGAVLAVAEAWASIDGTLDKFRTDDGSDPTLGYRDGYLTDAASLIERIGSRGFVVEPRVPDGLSTPPATPALGLIEGEQGSSNASPSQPVAGRHGPEADQ